MCFLSALSQNPDDPCNVTKMFSNELDGVLNVPPGTVCFVCVVNGTVDHNATFEINNNLPTEVDGVTAEDGVLVVLDTSATFYPSIGKIVRCTNNEIQSSVYLEGITLSCACVCFNMPSAELPNFVASI